MLDGLGGTPGARETGVAPTYMAAEAETSELPKIVVETPPVRPASPVKRSRIGDLPMRVIYRVLAGVTAVVVAAIAVLVGFVSSDSADRPGEEAPGRVAAPSAAVPSPGLGSPQPSPPAATPSPLAATSSPAAASPSPGPTPDGSAVTAALADPRVPGPPRDRKLARFPGKALPSKRRVEDEKSGVSLVRLGKPWKTYGASPFSTKQVLPPVKGAGHRAMLVSCPVPIEAQASLKDTAILAARWTLNHHPKGSRLHWSASQPLEDGWLLAYRVTYKVKGKSRSSMAAVVLSESGRAKPAMVFVTIPDAQRKRWRDINTAALSVERL
ncbi:hypothetical protein [Planomonospora parontospora]|uniref:hypothetical protein n=1 Tax=Planomonospora parontospora TaxID=58119 RepID=UPI0016703B00|nr:hypothetical protein [Planomonospora parontospora]GGL18180.1 hypothetical protein GCM10014719_20400 [Planomonospora parontospora subsp. antibiotica]GII15584.1 hypothetical protein Ppa05_23100 [Planomonospora parontospora subsp. antibiotica]